MGKAHRATGNPRGRPSRLPLDFNQQILNALKRRIDPRTGLARPDWKGIADNKSRSTGRPKQSYWATRIGIGTNRNLTTGRLICLLRLINPRSKSHNSLS